jgi:GTPase
VFSIPGTDRTSGSSTVGLEAKKRLIDTAHCRCLNEGGVLSGSFPSLDELRAGSKRLLARVLTRLETHASDPETAAFLDKICAEPCAHVLGLTGPPGVGKSSLTDALIKSCREQDERVAVLAVDPSSAITGGALLGDRTRLKTDPSDDNVFVRSMAARNRLGGLSDHTVAAIALLRAVYDRVLVETVGIGQSEGDLKQAVDTVVLCIQPGSGDSLQFMKAGIMELPDIVAVTKADMGTLARRAASDVAGALTLGSAGPASWRVPVCMVSSQTGEGIAELLSQTGKHHAFLENIGNLASRRRQQHVAWFEDMVRSEFGQLGLTYASGDTQGNWRLRAERAPFESFSKFSDKINSRLLH